MVLVGLTTPVLVVPAQWGPVGPSGRGGRGGDGENPLLILHLILGRHCLLDLLKAAGQKRVQKNVRNVRSRLSAEETTLIEADIMERTLRFLFGDPAGVKATGPSGAATRATLGLIVNCFAVRNALWPSRRAEIKALLDDEQGRFDKEELLTHIINDALGRPLLPPGKPTRDVGTAANNAVKKQKKETAEAKDRTRPAMSAARAAAREDASRLPEVAAAEAVQAAELAAVLAQEYDLKLPDWTPGAKRKREAPDLSEALRQAEAAHRAAKQELARTQHELDALGPQPTIEYPADLDDKAGEAAAWRRWEREREIRDRATQANLAAHTARCRRQDEMFAARYAYMEQENEEASRREEEMERRFSEMSRGLAELPELISNSIQVRCPHARCLSVAPPELRRSRCAGFDRFGDQTPKICNGGLG